MMVTCPACSPEPCGATLHLESALDADTTVTCPRCGLTWTFHPVSPPSTWLIQPSQQRLQDTNRARMTP